jgi:sterol desaturase/sphingolipid hydroxylase (fatty acid hydroxylase superfamily)
MGGANRPAKRRARNVPYFLFTDRFLETVRRWDGRLLSPSPENRHTRSVQVFRSGWFDRYFATAHPIMPGLWWGPIVVGCLLLTALDPRFHPLRMIGGYVGGLLAWTLLEYLLHRYVFHLPPGERFAAKLNQFILHGYHHEFPNDARRLVMPLVFATPIAVLIALGYYLALGPHRWLAWFAGTVTGYIAYDWVHYYTHHFRPTTRIGKFIRRYHMEHHYKDSDSHFGISSPLWDYVFGTARSRDDAPAMDKRGAASA